MQVGVFGRMFLIGGVFFFFVVMGNPATQSSGRGSFFLGNILIRVEIEDGGRKAKVESGWLDKEVAWET